MSTFWYQQVYFNFRLFYLVPLVMYFIIHFLKNNRSESLWLGGIIGISMFLGSIQYFAGLWLFYFFLMSAVLVMHYRNFYKHIFVCRKLAIGLAVVFFLTALFYFLFLEATLNGVSIATGNRDVRTGASPIENFLIHGGILAPSMVIDSLVTGNVQALFWGSSVYVGIFPLVFFIWAIFNVKNPIYYAFLTTAIMLVALSSGGMSAKIIYYFPLMHYFRHIALIYGLIKIPILICSAFGFEHFLNHYSKKIIGIRLCVVLFFLILVFIKAKMFYWWATSLVVIFVFGMVCWELYFKKLKNRISRKMLASIVLIVCVLDMCFYQQTLYKNRPMVSKYEQGYLNSTKVNNYAYQPQRTLLMEKNPSDRRYQAMALLRSSPGNKNQWEYGFVQEDFCFEEFIVSQMTSHLHRLTEINPVLPNVLGGCFDPKLRLFEVGKYFYSAQQEQELFEKMNGILNRIVQGDKSKMSEALLAVNHLFKNVVFIRTDHRLSFEEDHNKFISDDVGRTKIIKFNSDEILTDVDVFPSGGAWLFYADAYHPDWHAFIDGKESRIFLANGAFKAVHLDKGQHSVHFYFDQGYVSKLGYFLAIFGIIMSLLFCWFISRTILAG